MNNHLQAQQPILHVNKGPYTRMKQALLLITCLMFAHTASAEVDTMTPKKLDMSVSSEGSLADQTEILKNDIIKLNRDLLILEEDLLFPASTQTAVFLSIDGSGLFQLDSAKVAIDKKPVGHHLYTEKEIAALSRGAVQRLFTGNVSNGKHELVIVLSGIGPKGRDYKRAAQLEFDKGTAAQYIELKIEANPSNLQPDFTFKIWQ